MTNVPSMFAAPNDCIMKFLLPLFALTIVLTGSACISFDDDQQQTPVNPNQAQIDRDLILQYISQQGISATADPSGLFYRIIAPGGDARPELTSDVEIRYRGELLDGTVFDETPNNSTIIFTLNELISGWQIGIPLIGRAGSIELIIPSGLGYGTRQVGDIPPNSVLFFRVDLVDFFN